MVIFQSPDGSPGYTQVESLDDAVAVVEELRNERGVTNARLFALEEIKFEMKPVFKVELQALTAGSGAAGGAAEVPTAPPAPPQPPRDQPTPAPPADQPTPAPPADQPTPARPAAGQPTPAPPGGPATTPPAAPDTPPASGDDGGAKEQPTRRGLFGR